MKFVILALSFAVFISCGKKSPQTVVDTTPAIKEDAIFNSTEGKSPTPSTPSSVEELNAIEQVLKIENTNAPFKNYLFDQILDINLNIEEAIPELNVRMYPNDILSFKQTSVENGTYEYVLGNHDLKDHRNFIVSFTAKVTFFSQSRNIALIELTDLINNNKISILRAQKKGQIFLDPQWLEWDPKNISSVDALEQGLWGTVVINKKLQAKTSKAFVNLLEDIIYHPYVTYTQYHVLKNKDEASLELPRSEKVEITVANSFHLQSLDIKVDRERLSNEVRMHPSPIHWTIGMRRDELSINNDGFFSYLNPANYYFRQPNLTNQAFVKDAAKKEFQTWLNVPEHNYEDLLRASHVNLKWHIRPTMGAEKGFEPFTLRIDFLENN